MEQVVPTTLFAAGVLIAVGGIVLVSGFLPPSAMPVEWASGWRAMLVWGDALLVAVFSAYLVFFAIRWIDWPVAVIAGGLAAVAAPPLFQLLPGRLRDGEAGLALLPVTMVGVAGLSLLK